MNTTTSKGIGFDKILMYASSKIGFDADNLDPATASRVEILAKEGAIVLRERTVEVPGINMPESCKAVSMFDTWSPRSVTLRTWHRV